MIREIGFEIRKIFVQKKNYIVLAGHLLMVVLVYIAFKRRGGVLDGSVNNMFENSRGFLDGLFFARSILDPTFLVIMPIFVATLAGDIIAGEIQDGSLKLYLARPRSRIRLMMSKILAVYGVTLLYSIYFTGFCLVIGLLCFGWPHPVQLIVLRGEELGNSIAVLELGPAFWRYLATGIYYSFSMMALGCIVVFLSTLFNRMTAATVAGITLYFVSYIIQHLPFAETLAPYTLSHIMSFPDLYVTPFPIGRLAANLTGLGAYIAVFTFGAITIFSTKDIK